MLSVCCSDDLASIDNYAGMNCSHKNSSQSCRWGSFKRDTVCAIETISTKAQNASSKQQEVSLNHYSQA